jgi:hypothetical protein
MKLLWLPLGQGQSKAILFINPTIQQSQRKKLFKIFIEMKLLWLPLGQGQSKAIFINTTIQHSQLKKVVQDIY